MNTAEQHPGEHPRVLDPERREPAELGVDRLRRGVAGRRSGRRRRPRTGAGSPTWPRVRTRCRWAEISVPITQIVVITTMIATASDDVGEVGLAQVVEVEAGRRGTAPRRRRASRSTRIPVVQIAQPPRKPAYGPSARVTQEKVVPQSGVDAVHVVEGRGDEEHRHEREQQDARAPGPRPRPRSSRSPPPASRPGAVEARPMESPSTNPIASFFRPFSPCSACRSAVRRPRSTLTLSMPR